MDYIKATLQFLFLMLSNIVCDVLGLFVVAIAIPFRVPGKSLADGSDIVNLPAWAGIWGNDYDGLLGDSRGWWAANTPFGWPVDSYMAMWWWAAIRNPANNMRLKSWWQAPIVGSVITYKGDYTVEDKPGQGGWQFVKIVSAAGKSYYGFYYVHEWSDTAAFVIRFGYKVKPSHAGTNEPAKGFTTKINPYKSI